MKSSRIDHTATGPRRPDLDGPWFGLPAGIRVENGDSVATSMRFRARVLEIDHVLDAPAPLHIAADSRYRLTVNGELVAAGPAKPSGGTWFADTVDVGPHLVGR